MFFAAVNHLSGTRSQTAKVHFKGLPVACEQAPQLSEVAEWGLPFQLPPSFPSPQTNATENHKHVTPARHQGMNDSVAILVND